MTSFRVLMCENVFRGKLPHSNVEEGGRERGEQEGGEGQEVKG